MLLEEYCTTESAEFVVKSSAEIPIWSIRYLPGALFIRTWILRSPLPRI